MSINYVALLIFFCVLQSVVSPLYAQRVLFSPDRYTTIEHRPVEKVKLIFDVRPRQTIDDKNFDAYMAVAAVHFGLDGTRDAVVTSVRLEWEGLPPIYLAESAFTDLHSPYSVSVAQKGVNILLEIVGGDTAATYQATIEVAPYGVVSRRVHNRLSGYEQISTYAHTARSVEARMSVLNKFRDKKFEK